MAKFKNPTTGLVVEQENRTPQDLANQGFVPVAETEPSISIDKLKTETPINITGIEESPIFPISSLDTTVSEPLKMGKEETKAQGLTERLMELNKELTGESTLRAEEETKVGLPELIKTQTDLSSRLKAIQAEEKAIPLQLQQESLGRGITTSGLQPLQTARLRENAIRALSVSSLLEASKGNITTAQDLADRAVSQKYEPIKAEINTLTKNLDLIIKSPKYSLEDKNRAQAQLDIQNQKKLDLEKKEKDEQEIMKIANEAASSGANSIILDKISKSVSPSEALQIASSAGVYMPTDERKLIFEGYKLLKPSQLSGYTENQILRLPNGNIYLKPIEEQNDVVQSYINQIKKGSIKITSVPSSIRNEVITELDKQGVSSQTSTKISTKEVESNILKNPIESGYKEGDIIENKDKFYIVTPEGTTRQATTEEKKKFTEPQKFGWTEARQLISDNPDASNEELKSALLEYTDLTSSEINSILATR